MASPETNSSPASARKERTDSSSDGPVAISRVSGACPWGETICAGILWPVGGGCQLTAAAGSTRGGPSGQLQGEFDRPGAVGEGAHRDEVHPGGGHPGEPLPAHPPARLEGHPAGGTLHGGGKEIVVHVVEQDQIRAGG